MRVSALSTLAFGSFLASAAAQSDLDASVWKGLESQSHSKRLLSSTPRNRPVKRQSGWNPPSDLKNALSEVWEHYESTYDGGITGNNNWGYHQIMANKGYLNICVRWDSDKSVTAAQRSQIATKYAEQYQKWFKWLYGFNGFPYSNVKVNIVGWAVRDTSLLQGSTDGIDVYTGLDPDGVPACDVGCARDAHLDGDYSGCKGGAERHYDHSLWLTEGLEGGFGYSWGQQVGREYFMNNIDSENIHILLHEMGHTFGLDDFYDWTPTGVSNFIMLAGSSMEITDFDGWMLRNWWYELAQKNDWASSSTSGSSDSESEPAASESAPAAASSSPSDAAPTTAPAEEVQEQEAAATTPVEAVSAAAPVATSAPSTGNTKETASQWAQCGGKNWKGATNCASGFECVAHNEYYSQCL
ncbi:hypothetical protein ACJZ2D_003728 [Fusarium nematophilum]